MVDMDLGQDMELAALLVDMDIRRVPVDAIDPPPLTVEAVVPGLDQLMKREDAISVDAQVSYFIWHEIVAQNIVLSFKKTVWILRATLKAS